MKLLIYFILIAIIAATFIVDLHSLLAAVAKSPPRPDQQIFLTLEADLSLALGDNAIAYDALPTALNGWSQSARDILIFLRADRTAPLDALMGIMNVRRSIGYLKIALLGFESTDPNQTSPLTAAALPSMKSGSMP